MGFHDDLPGLVMSTVCEHGPMAQSKCREELPIQQWWIFPSSFFVTVDQAHGQNAENAVNTKTFWTRDAQTLQIPRVFESRVNLRL